jgi:hypothetical protein
VSRSTFQNAIDELEALLVTTGTTPHASLSSAGVTLVLDHEPGAEGIPKGCAVTLSPVGIEPDLWTIRVRLYIADRPADAAQALMIAATVAVDARIRGGVGFGPSRWEMGWSPELACWVSWSDLQVGREDYF